MGIEENKRVIRRMFEVIETGNFEAFDELMDPNFVYRSTAGEEVHGRDAMKDFLKMYYEAFSNFEMELQSLVAEGDTIFFTYRQRGRHNGNFWGIEATNKVTDIVITARVQFKGGKVLEVFETFDSLQLLNQLDALPQEAKQMLEGLAVPELRA
jgi:predicted ester cyclase